ncbi:unnamed protein product [Cercopithifilaria johnstoni]|uniref:Uncharacterized protein n=1 Tax=Cercopithifilaria johnstoni TaxID=2874296 RepID=A0A8J2M6V0_9BILA|nr:unnamed protein product [Cercopithifilaria johnstoni]
MLSSFSLLHNVSSSTIISLSLYTYPELLDRRFVIFRENRERKPAISSVNDIQPELLKVLYNLPPNFEVQVKNVEEKSGIKREHACFLKIHLDFRAV